MSPNERRRPSTGGALHVDRRQSITLRRLGYRVRAPRDPLGDRLARAGARLIPLNRLRPAEGHRFTACPRCGSAAALWVEPNGGWGTICGCAPSGGLGEIDLALFLAGAA